jgi:hypothetical protein
MMHKIILIVLFALFKFSLCDLPVHCIAKEISGEWHFFLSPE